MSLNKLNKFLEEISKLSPLNDEILLKMSSEEIVLLKTISKKKRLIQSNYLMFLKGTFLELNFTDI